MGLSGLCGNLVIQTRPSRRKSFVSEALSQGLIPPTLRVIIVVVVVVKALPWLSPWFVLGPMTIGGKRYAKGLSLHNSCHLAL
jgi:hypothetical protein